MQIIKELQDMRYLQWSKIRHSSGTAGSFLKAQEKRNGKKYYYKLSNYNAIEGIIGHESVNEIVVDRLLQYMNIEHLQYQLIHAIVIIEDKQIETYICASEDYKLSGESKLAFDVFYEMERKAGEAAIDFILRMGWENYIYDMLLIDFLILNRDRHGANIEVLRDKKKKSIRLAPLFDYGLSLIFQCYDEKSIDLVDVLEDKPVQCFVGTHSTEKNLQIIPVDKRRHLPAFDDTLKAYLFSGLEEIVTEKWMNTVWKMLCERAKRYEDLFN